MSASTKRVSRATLSRLQEQDDIVPDPRAQQLRSIAVTQDPAVLNASETVFEGTGVMADAGARLFCWVSSPLHVLISHGGAIVAVTIGGALAAVLIDRWRPRPPASRRGD